MPRLARILVTGGAGFIGSHIVDRLVDVGCEVKVVDDLSTGRLKNIQRLFGCGRVSFLQGDVRDLDVVRMCVKDVDVVVHLAAIVSVPFSVKHPRLTYEVNVDGTRSVLDACRATNVKRVVYVSSCAVYGEPQYLPVDEEHPAGPVSPYASSKFEAEQLCRSYQDEYGLDVVVLRLFNAYGARQKSGAYGGVVTRFVRCVKRGQPLVIYGDGSQTRDFIHVFDFSDAVLKVLESERVAGEVFNIGSGKPTSINDLAGMILRISGVSLDIVYDEPRKGDIKHSYADVSKAEKWFGFKPKISLEAGLRELIKTV